MYLKYSFGFFICNSVSAVLISSFLKVLSASIIVAVCVPCLFSIAVLIMLVGVTTSPKVVVNSSASVLVRFSALKLFSGRLLLIFLTWARPRYIANNANGLFGQLRFSKTSFMSWSVASLLRDIITLFWFLEVQVYIFLSDSVISVSDITGWWSKLHSLGGSSSRWSTEILLLRM